MGKSGGSNLSASKREKFSWRLLYIFHFLFKKQIPKNYAPFILQRITENFRISWPKLLRYIRKKGVMDMLDRVLEEQWCQKKMQLWQNWISSVWQWCHIMKKASVILGRPLNLKVKCRLRTHLLPFSRNLKIFSFTSESIFGASSDLNEISIPQIPFVYQLPEVFICFSFLGVAHS